ncbi:hypothetical protein M5K25_008738 [Dendrobium thyrsiflorum]|uniref:Uncharacterized protein n=1 Tax=Dendrobium thyrsiflorum TaxID=117978 RepID=A0ABD0V9A8_DENTH
MSPDQGPEALEQSIGPNYTSPDSSHTTRAESAPPQSPFPPSYVAIHLTYLWHRRTSSAHPPLYSPTTTPQPSPPFSAISSRPPPPHPLAQTTSPPPLQSPSSSPPPSIPPLYHNHKPSAMF